ncbi:uncharacterized protein LOC126848849 isoform X2 [Cataglyphis hispanica]|uniref:uncharacterized protein LOC126848849 isoform X2 n=1 Tax=Cataglyphis hispanica TaxID=1086592 RepID=UPI00218078F1|nr:uncharacterized protein LOC126848849 isoform X2 [Cataglyphis hispanica]
MSKKQWLVLLMLFLTYLLLGASIFYYIEGEKEMDKIAKAKEERIEINQLLHDHYGPSIGHTQKEILDKLSEYCGKSVHNYTEGEVDPHQWDFYNSFYFAYTVVSTIGYGNLAPTNTLSRILMIFYGLVGIPMNGILLTQLGQDDTKGSGPFFIMYKIFLIFWISFGLGYIVMIMTFIARGMRSKKITRLEHKLAMNLKHTQSKIWNEFNKEVNYLRRVFNELQLSKVKRVYVDEYDYEVPPTKFSRSNSFPDLRKLTIGGYVDNSIPHPRRRANSEVVPIQLTRVVSETDLQRIDKTATFATHAIVQPAELLARLVNILGYIPPRDDFDWDDTEDQLKQVDAQNEMQQSKPVDQGLANNVTQWTIGGEKFPFEKPRSRAVSEVRLYTKDYAKDDYVNQNTEWTWSGPVASTKLQELMKTRNTISSLSSNNSNKPYKKFPSLALPITAPKNFFPRWKKRFMNKKSSDVDPNVEKVIDTMDDSNRENNSIGPIDPLPSYLDERYDSISKTPNYYTHTGCNLPSYLENNNLLEETSLADFLRALTALHPRVGTVPDECVAKPKRKLGTACLSPPKLPSLFTLFSPNTLGSDSATHSNQNTVSDVTSHQSSRRMSLKMAENGYSGSTTPTSYMRKESSAVKPRRFSLRPVKTPVNSLTPPDYASPRSSLRLSQKMADQNQGPYISPESFISVSPKEPLVNMERPPGISSPIQQPFNTRRFSIRSTQLSPQPSANTSLNTSLHTPKPLPRWKAGMLQRQITQMNLRRRVRAFSLSDVYSDVREKSTNPISPLAMDTTNKFVDVSKLSNPNQKTVTIMSPAEEMNMTLKNEFQNSMVAPDNLKEQISSWRNQEDVTPIKSLSRISDESSVELNESISNILEDGRYPQGNNDFISVYEPVYKLRSSDEKLINDTLTKTVQREVQETNMDDKDASLKMEKQNDIHMCIIDNLDGPQEPKFSTSSKNFSESRKEKPSVPIDFYKPVLQATIEKPAINPFEQYRVMTKSDQTKDAELTEIKIEKPHEK